MSETVRLRPEGRATWRKVIGNDPVYGAEPFYQGIIVDGNGAVVWESAGEAGTIFAARHDAKHGGPHWSIDGQRAGFLREWAWLPLIEVRSLLAKNGPAGRATLARYLEDAKSV